MPIALTNGPLEEKGNTSWIGGKPRLTYAEMLIKVKQYIAGSSRESSAVQHEEKIQTHYMQQ